MSVVSWKPVELAPYGRHIVAMDCEGDFIIVSCTKDEDGWLLDSLDYTYELECHMEPVYYLDGIPEVPSIPL